MEMITRLAALFLALLGGYCLAMSRVAAAVPRAEQLRRLAMFAVGLVGTLAVFLPSPDLFGPDYRFTVSMGQMLLAINLAPLFLLQGIPEAMLAWLVRHDGAQRFLSNPLLTGLTSTMLFFIWFVPGIFEAASSSWILWMIKEAASLLSGLIFWWPVATTLLAWRTSLPKQIFYLIAMRFPMAVLGILFTLSSRLFYRSRSFALEICAPASLPDQQLGGLIMWTLGGLILFVAFAVVFLRWFQRYETASTR